MGDIYHAGEVYAGSVPIDDTQASEETVYSSAKVETMIEGVQEDIDAIESGLQEISEDAYTPSYSYSGSKMSLKKWGRIVTFQGATLNNTLPVQNYITIYDALPAKYRPKSNVSYSGVDNTTGTPYSLVINTSGVIQIYIGASTQQIIRMAGACLSYISAN